MLLCAVGAQSATGTITGQVVDAASGLPLSGVPVHLTDTKTADTDGDGRFRFDNVPSESQTLTVSVVGYAPFRRALAVGAGGSIHVLIPLVGGTGTYTERVQVIGDLFRQSEPAVPAQQL